MQDTQTKKLVYPTDNIKSLHNTIQSRARLYTDDFVNSWSTATPKQYTTPQGEEILDIYGLEVMSDFETPYMHALARIISQGGGRVLNVGFGLGIIDSWVQQNAPQISEHHVIELNQTVFNNAEKWKEKQPQSDKINLHQGNWRDVLPKLAAAGVVFDGVVYDAFPLTPEELHRDAVDFLEMLFELQLVRPAPGSSVFIWIVKTAWATRFSGFYWTTESEK